MPKDGECFILDANEGERTRRLTCVYSFKTRCDQIHHAKFRLQCVGSTAFAASKQGWVTVCCAKRSRGVKGSVVPPLALKYEQRLWLAAQ